MSSIMLPEEANNLFALAEAIAKVLGDRHTAPTTVRSAEAQLRAGLAAAAFARGAYEAILGLPGAGHPKRSLTKLIAEIHILLDPEDASSMAEFVLSMR